MKHIAVIVIFAFVTSPLTVMAQDPEETRVFIQDFESLGADKSVAAELQKRIAGAIGERGGYSVVSSGAVGERLADEITKDPACKSAECRQAMRDVTDANFLLYGSLGVVAEDRVASITLIDLETARPVGGSSATFSSDDETLTGAGALVGQTFGWDDAPEFKTAGFTLPETGSVRIAVMELSGLGLPDETSKNLTQVLGGSLKQIQGAEIITAADIRSMLEFEVAKQQLGCTDVSCMAEIGGALGVDRMISGSVGLMGERYVVSLRLVNPRKATIEGRITESFVGDESQLLPAIRYSGKKLLGAVGATSGTLAVGSNEAEAALFVDDSELGELPMQAVGDIEPGRHSLRVAKSGYFDWRSDVFIEPGSATPIWVELQEKPPAWYETWWFWTAVGVVAAGTTTLYIVNERSLQDTDLGNVDLGD